MKRFQFRLASILTLRLMEQNEAEGKYSAAIEVRRKIEQQILDVQGEYEQVNRFILQSREGGFSPADQAQYGTALENKVQQVAELKDLLQRAKNQENSAREVYIEARKKHELLDKLRERKLADHTAEQLLQEQMESDDLYNARRRFNQLMKQS